MRLERAEWGTDLPSVESQLETQRHIHASVEDLGSSVKEARMYEVQWGHWEWPHVGTEGTGITSCGSHSWDRGDF